MSKFGTLDSLVASNGGYLKTSDVIAAGISKTYLAEYVRKRNLYRVSRGLYIADGAWADGMYVLQTRFPDAIFSHETALYLLGMADREPVSYSLTVKSGVNTTRLTRRGVTAYTIKRGLFEMGLMDRESPAGHMLRVYGPERTVCDLIRNRSKVEIQDLRTAIREYVGMKGRNIPLLMRYAKELRVERLVRQYMETML